MSLYQPAELMSISLDCINREFPYALEHAFDAPTEISRPSELHPAFFGCFDWHSAVHNHWLLVRLQREFPELENSGAARAVLDAHFEPAVLAAELKYFAGDDNANFSRPYGWCWLIRLHAEAAGSPGPQAARWTAALQPLRDELAWRLGRYFSTILQFPVRTGLHSNSAFALTLALDAARATDDQELERELLSSARRMYLDDRDYPSILEPSGGDFLSPGLTEAGLMSSVLGAQEFSAWLDLFMPSFADPAGFDLLSPPVYLANASDPGTVHLNGLLLTKTWSLSRIVSALGVDDPRREVLVRSALSHLAAAQTALDDRNYHATHWIPTFTVLAYDAARDAGIATV
jgi:hypothetical protein